jgi:MFS family permease
VSGLTVQSALASAVSKAKWRLLPLFVVMFIVNYVDRVNVSFIKPQLEASLGIGATAYGIGAGLFFWGYALFEVPANVALERLGARRWLTLIAAVWGALAALLAFVRDANEFYALRFLLGAAEAGFFPGVVYYFTRWFPAAERGRAMAIFLSGSAIASVISGPLSAGLLSIEGLGLHGWQWMVLIEGVFSVAMAGVLWIWLDSLPAEARWLNEAERTALSEAVESERKAAITRPKAGLGELLVDPRLLFFCWVYFAIQLTIYAVTFWLPEIIRGMGDLTNMQVGLLNSVPWLISIVGMYLFAVAAARRPGQQGWVAVALTLAGLGMFAATLGGPVAGFVCICVSALGFKSAASLFWPIPQKELDPRIAAAGIALINSLGNLGGFVAPTAFGWIKETTGSVTWGLHGLAASSLLTAALVLLVRFRRA